MNEKTYYTHAGLFHCDEVAGFAICRLAGVVDYLARMTDVNMIPDRGVVADIGRVHDPKRRRFDHHQAFMTRENGYPLASAGLLWQEYGIKALERLMVENPKEVHDLVDERLIQGIDAHDADGSYHFDAECCAGPVRAMSLPMAISAFNHHDVNAHGIQHQNFQEAARFFETVLVGVIRQADAFVKARDQFEKIARFEESGRVIVLESPAPWKEIVHEKHPNAIFVISPSAHPGSPYSMTAVPVHPDRRSIKCFIRRPEWFSGFIHEGKWIAGGESVDELLRLAQYNLSVLGL